MDHLPRPHGHKLVRVVGTTPRRAQVGCCPRYTRAAHIAAPLVRNLGEYHPVEPRVLALWNKFGPWAPRRLAALHFAKSDGSLSSARGWAAASLLMEAPDPLFRAPSPDFDVSRWKPTLAWRLFVACIPPPLRPRPFRPPLAPSLRPRIWTGKPRKVAMINRRHLLPSIVCVGQGTIAEDWAGKLLPPQRIRLTRSPTTHPSKA